MIHTIFLQQQQGGTSMLLMIGGIFLIMYLFIIRPQQKKSKQEKQFQLDLKRGDLVVTTSGIHGKINEIYDDSVLLETGAGKIKFEKVAISKEFTAARYSKSEAKKDS